MADGKRETARPKFDSLTRAIQGNFDHLMGVIRNLGKNFNILVDDVQNLADEQELTNDRVEEVAATAAAAPTVHNDLTGRSASAAHPASSSTTLPYPLTEDGVFGASTADVQTALDELDGHHHTGQHGEGPRVDFQHIKGGPPPGGDWGSGGEDGPSGPPGERGATGSTGSTGASGADGAAGATGASGRDGVPGMPGDDGESFFFPGPAGPAASYNLDGGSATTTYGGVTGIAGGSA